VSSIPYDHSIVFQTIYKKFFYLNRDTDSASVSPLQSVHGWDHDGHCNNLLPSIRSKKWIWVVFIRLIQAAITNSVVIFNAAGNDKIKVGPKDFAISIAKSYIYDGERKQKKTSSNSRKQAKKLFYLSCKNISFLY